MARLFFLENVKSTLKDRKYVYQHLFVDQYISINIFLFIPVSQV